MNIQTHLTYIEWRDTKGLHEDTIQSISELKFVGDELRFLKDVVASHTSEIMYGALHEKGAQLDSQLQFLQNKGARLLKELFEHSNNLQVLLDDVDVPDELKNYKNSHYKLMIAIIDLNADVKKVKRIIFKMLTEVMKKRKKNN